MCWLCLPLPGRTRLGTSRSAAGTRSKSLSVALGVSGVPETSDKLLASDVAGRLRVADRGESAGPLNQQSNSRPRRMELVVGVTSEIFRCTPGTILSLLGQDVSFSF